MGGRNFRWLSTIAFGAVIAGLSVSESGRADIPSPAPLATIAASPTSLPGPRVTKLTRDTSGVSARRNPRKTSYTQTSSCDYYGCTYSITATEFETIPFMLAGRPDTCGEPQPWTPSSGQDLGGGITNQGPVNSNPSVGIFAFQVQPGATGRSFQVGELTNGGFCQFAAYYTSPFVEANFFINVPQRAPSLDLNEPYCPLCMALAGDPMDVVSGAFWEKKTDLQMPGPNGLRFMRFYGSEMPDSGDLGAHWSDNFSDSEFIYATSAVAQVSPAPATSMARSRNASGRKRDVTVGYVAQQSFYLDPEQMPHYYGQGGGYDPITGTTLSEDPGGKSATLKFFDGRVLNFDAAGKLVKTTDRIGNTQTIVRNATEQIQSVADALGRQLCFYYNSGDSRIASVGEWFSSAACPASVSATAVHVSYTYDNGNDPSGNLNCTTTQLCSATEPDGRTWTYGYVGNAELAAIYDPLGNPEVTNTYSGYAIASQQRGKPGEVGGKLQFTYPQPLPTSSSDPLGHTQVTNPDTGEVSDFYFNAQGMVVQRSGKLCDCHGYQQATYTYDGYDRITSESDSGNQSSGAAHVITYTYGRDTSTTQYPGPTAITETLNAAGAQRSQSIAYYPIGDLRQDLPRTIQRQSIDSPGMMKTSTYTFSPQGLLIQKDDTGYVSGAATTHTTKMTYDARGRMLTSTLPRTDLNETTTMAYFADNDSDLMRAGQLSGSTDALGHASSIIAGPNGTYDPYGNALMAVDANGVQTSAAYDAWGRPLSTTIFGVPYDSTNLTEKNTYDGAGRLVGHTRPLGNGVSYTLDSSDRIVAQTRVDASGAQYEQMTMGYNSADEVIAQAAQGCAQPSSSCSAWTTTTATGYGYDSFGNMVAVMDPQTNTLNGILPDQKLITYTNQRRPATALDENHSALNVAGGISINSSSASVGDYGWTYDLAGRATSAIRFLASAALYSQTTNISTNYAYDTDDNVNAITDPNGNVTTYHYDDFGNALSETSPVSGVTSYRYDADDNLSSMVDATGASTAYTYDALDRPTQSVSTKPSQPSETVTWAYDKLGSGSYGIGRLASMTDPAGTTTYGYDRRGNVILEQRVLDSYIFNQRYAYDGNGNRSTMFYSDGLVLGYGYDYADRPYSITQLSAGAQAAIARTRASRPLGTGVRRGTERSAIAHLPTRPFQVAQDIRRPIAQARTIRNFSGPLLHVPADLHPREHIDAEARRALLALAHMGSLASPARPRAFTRYLAGGGTSIVGSTTYEPFGPLTSQSFGNGTTQKMLFDARYRPMQNELTTATGAVLANLQYAEDATGNIIAITDALDPRFSRAYLYDDMNRLTASVTGTAANAVGIVGNQTVATPSPSPANAIGLWGSAVYQYDRMGNMTAQQVGARVDAFQFSGTTSKLTSVTASSTVGGSVTYDAAGNETVVGLNSYQYSPRNELISASGPEYYTVPAALSSVNGTAGLSIDTPWTYKYDGNGTRLSTTINVLAPTTSIVPGSLIPRLHLFTRATRYSIPGPDGQLATETSTTNIGLPAYDYVWMGGKPIAQIDATGTHYDFTDHLDAPTIQTNAAGAVTYQADYEPYGSVYDLRGTANPHQPLRLPGQTAEQFDTGANGATDLSYNNARFYRSEWGRFSQTDLLDLNAGPNLFTYSLQNPINVIDPTGLCTILLLSHSIPGVDIFDNSYFPGTATHGFLLVLDPAGSIAYRGGPTHVAPDPLDGGFGYVETERAQPFTNSSDYSGYVEDIENHRHRPDQVVINDNVPCSCYEKQLDQALKEIQDARVKYSPLPDAADANSNTVLSFLLSAIAQGRYKPRGPYWYPGFGAPSGGRF